LRGPALDSIAARMTEDQITRQVLQGGGNMPSYGNALNPSETTALVHFLLTLRGPRSHAGSGRVSQLKSLARH
jgi:ubiquinol-cytochrome c reductase cytochrome b subunit